MTIRLDWPTLVSRADFDELIAHERRVGLQMLEEGVLRRIWRIPGQRANIGIWEAPDATTLVGYLDHLPLRQWLVADVIPLATHELEISSRSAEGPSKGRVRQGPHAHLDSITTNRQERT